MFFKSNLSQKRRRKACSEWHVGIQKSSRQDSFHAKAGGVEQHVATKVFSLLSRDPVVLKVRKRSIVI